MKEKPKEDKVLIQGDTAIRECDGKLQAGTFRPAREGEPIPEGHELVYLGDQREDGWYNVAASFRNSGPAQVATRAYRDGYDRIFGKQKVGLA